MIYGKQTPRLHRTVAPFEWMPWFTINVVPGWLPLVLSVFLTSAPAIVVIQLVEENISDAQQRDISDMYRLVPVPAEFAALAEETQDPTEPYDGLTFAIPLLSVSQPEPEIVEVIREVEVPIQDPELLRELRTVRSDNSLLTNRIDDLNRVSDALRAERDAALANARDQSSNASRWEVLARDLAVENARLTAEPVAPEAIGYFGYVGHRVFQSPPPGREVVGEPIILELVGEPLLLGAHWSVFGCGFIRTGGESGPVFRFRVVEPTRCQVMITEPGESATDDINFRPIRGEYYVNIERVRQPWQP